MAALAMSGTGASVQRVLSSFAFDEFERCDFTRAHVRRELFRFNDQGSAVVSRRNRFRGMVDPHVGLS